MERAHGLGVMGNARTGIISTVLDSQLQDEPPKGDWFCPKCSTTLD